MAVRYELDIRDYIRIIRRHKWKILTITSTITLITLVSSILTKPKPLYQATVSIAIEKKDNEPSSMFGGFSSKDYSVLESETELIKSFPVVFAAAKKVGIIPANISYDGFQNDQNVLNRVLSFQNKINVTQQGDTNIIDITVENHDPELARNGANIVAEVYKEQNREKNSKQSKASREFVEGRLKLSRKELKEAENKLKHFEETYDIIAMDAQSRILLKDETSLKEFLSLNKSKSEEMESMSISFKKDQKSYDDILVDVRPGGFSPNFTRLLSTLTDQTSKKKFLLTVYTEKNPEVITVQNKINISIDNIKGQLRSSLEILEQERENLNAKLDKVQAELAKVPESSLNYGRLKRKVIAKNEIVALLDERYQEALIREADQVEEIRVVRPALFPQSPINPPKVNLKTILGFALGLIISLIASFIFENVDTSFDTIDDLENIIKLPVVGVIPFINLKELLTSSDHDLAPFNLTPENPLSRLIMHFFPKKPIAESFRSLRTNVVFEASRDKAKVICVTSSLPGEGKSTISANLALSFAQAGKHILLLDMDLRKSTLHQVFGVEKTPGLVDLVLESVEPSYAIRDITDIIMGEIGMDLIARTPGWDNFDFIPTGSSTRGSETEILNSNKLKGLIKKWKEEYDYIVIDLPPVLVASDAQIISPLAEKMLLVYRVGEVARGSLLRAKTQVDSVKAKVMGIVLNGLKEEMSTDFGQYQYYSAYYRDEEEKPKRTLLEILKSPHLILESFRLILKSPQFIMTTVIVLVIISSFLFSVRSWQEVVLKFTGVDFLITGLFFLFLGMAYFGISLLLNKLNLSARYPIFSILQEKLDALPKIFKKKEILPTEDKDVEEVSEPDQRKEEPDVRIKEPESFTEEEKEISPEESKEEGISREEDTDVQIKEKPDPFSQEEKEKIDDIDKKLDETKDQTKKGKDKKDKDESYPDDWDAFLGT